MIRWMLGFALFALAMESVSASHDTDPNALPAGEARDLLLTACVGCHNLDTVTDAVKTPAEWKATIYDMMSRGAQIFPDEVDTLVEYFDENLKGNGSDESSR